MVNNSIDNFVVAMLSDNSWLGLMSDWLMKSMLIVLVSALLIALFRKQLASGSKHLLWLNIFLCTALVPAVYLMTGPASVDSPYTTTLITIEVSPTAGNSLTTYANSVIDFTSLALLVYLLPLGILLLRLFNSATRVFRIGKRASEATGQALQQRIGHLCKKLRIRREVQIKFSNEILSPLSYGLLHPAILLPQNAKNWEHHVIDDVLIHELSHIKRLDWLSMFFAYLVSSLFWINPLLWMALKKLNEEAENSCDSAVLQYGQSETNYAENLLGIAKNIKQDNAKPLLAQMMLDKSLLPGRIHRILESDMAKATTHRLFGIPLSILATTILVACTGAQLMSVESASRPPPVANRDSGDLILPVTAEAPQYPLRAAFAGTEGWALTEFTVLSNGDVAADSITIADAEPADIFNRASIRAVQKFKFEPIAGAEAEEIPGVQYLFRYSLGEDESNEINRDFRPINTVEPEFPAQASAQGIAGGNVWTVFHVTRAGTVQDVMVNYSSNDVFDQSAIAAAQALRFPDRTIDDNVPGNVRGDTSGLVRAHYLFRFER